MRNVQSQGRRKGPHRGYRADRQRGQRSTRRALHQPLFDGEIVALPGDAQVLWKNIIASGFSLPNPAVVHVERVDQNTAGLFSDSREVAVFFKKYVPDKATLCIVDSDNGTFYFVLGDRVSGIPRIIAFKGPVL